MLQNVAWVGAASIVESALGLAAGVVIARALGPSDYGHYAFAVWLCGVMLIFVNNGLLQTSVRYLAEVRGSAQPELAPVMLSRLKRYQMLSMAIVLTGFSLEGYLFPPEEFKHAAMAMLGISVVAILFRSDFRAQAAFGKGYEHFVAEAITLICMAPVNIALIAVAAWQGAGVVHFFAIYAVVGMASALMVRFILHRARIRPRPGTLPPELNLRMRRYLLQSGVLMLLFALSNRAVEMALLKEHTDIATVGYFAIAMSLTKGALDVLMGGLSAVLLPDMARRYARTGLQEIGQMVAEYGRLHWYIGMVITGLGLSITDTAIQLLYGQKYLGAIPALTWMLAISGVLTIYGAIAAGLSAADKQGERIRVMATTLAVNLALGLVLVPRYGLWGALISSGLTQIFDALLASFRLRRHTTLWFPLRPMALATMAMFTAAALARLVAHLLPVELGLPAGVFVFMLVYAYLTVVWRTWRAAELDTLARLLARLGPAGRFVAESVMRRRDCYSLPELDTSVVVPK